VAVPPLEIVYAPLSGALIVRTPAGAVVVGVYVVLFATNEAHSASTTLQVVAVGDMSYVTQK
jgi:hypothetical protein